jgi:uncharacterized NAD(P)/FAD-binding protein YdhS
MPAHTGHRYDIVFLGSGISCSLTFLPLIKDLLKKPSVGEKIQIAIVEKKDEFWKGFPYGQRSSINSLTITTLGEFVPEPEKEPFIHWLETNLASWTEQIKHLGGEAGRKWLLKNLPFIEKKDWDDIYIPRHLFGLYLKENALKAIEAAAQKGIAQITLIEAEAVDLDRNRDGIYEITVEKNGQQSPPIQAGRVILAIGSPPVRSIQIPGQEDSNSYLYINDPYLPGMESNIQFIFEQLSKTQEVTKRNILIVGSNASSLELIYLLGHRPEIVSLLHQITVLSISGLLPHRITPNNFPDYQFENLVQLKQNKNYNADILMQTIETDMEIAYRKGIHIGDTYYQLSDLVVELLNDLSWVEQKYFYGAYGMRFTKLIRRAGAEYRDTAAELIRDKKIELVKGRFLRLEKSADKKTAGFVYQDTEKQNTHAHPPSFTVVVNCTGFEELQDSSSRLIRNLVEKKLCRVNSSNRGFEVNEDFEANKGLYVMGPLLGGIFNNKLRYWHVENAKRIYRAGAMLADTLSKT